MRILLKLAHELMELLKSSLSYINVYQSLILNSVFRWRTCWDTVLKIFKGSDASIIHVLACMGKHICLNVSTNYWTNTSRTHTSITKRSIITHSKIICELLNLITVHIQIKYQNYIATEILNQTNTSHQVWHSELNNTSSLN